MLRKATKGIYHKTSFISVHLLRHTAVHRPRTAARGVSKLIQYALKFTETLKDATRTLQLEELYKQIEAKIEETEPGENALDGAVTVMLQNKPDGIVPQGNDTSLEEEITALLEVLPTSFVPNQQLEYYSSEDDG